MYHFSIVLYFGKLNFADLNIVLGSKPLRNNVLARGLLNALQIHILFYDKLESSFNKYLETETSPDTRELIDKDGSRTTAGKLKREVRLIAFGSKRIFGA